MSDLISRQKLLKELTINRDGKRIPEVNIDNFPVTLTISQAKELIKNAPTAYDVDEVVVQIEKIMEDETIRFSDQVVRKAVKTVNAGGKVSKAVLIMDMPKCCADCRLVEDDAAGRYCTVI